MGSLVVGPGDDQIERAVAVQIGGSDVVGEARV
jgi:hypothetical protein